MMERQRPLLVLRLLPSKGPIRKKEKSNAHACALREGEPLHGATPARALKWLLIERESWMGGRDWHKVNSIICVCAKEGGKGERAAEERVVFTCWAASASRHTTAFKSDTAAGGKAGELALIVFLALMKTLVA